MNKFINDNISWVILLCVGLAVAAFVVALRNRKLITGYHAAAIKACNCDKPDTGTGNETGNENGETN